jgi:hypothetical protein
LSFPTDIFGLFTDGNFGELDNALFMGWERKSELKVMERSVTRRQTTESVNMSLGLKLRTLGLWASQ